MYANYHTHTWRCRHASGTEREYIEKAIEGGLRILGFSDHTPQFYDGDFYPDHEKMLPEQMDDYVTTILDLKKEYARDITIHLGLEVEYFPERYEQLMSFLGQYPLEYMIEGQHYLRKGLPSDVMVFRPLSDEQVLIDYVDICIAGMESGSFLYLAHPDVLHYIGNETPYRREMRRLCIRAKELGIPLEYNLYGFADGRNYPNPLFWEMAAEVGNQAVLGCDAHKVESVCPGTVIAAAEAQLEKLGITVLPDLEDFLVK